MFKTMTGVLDLKSKPTIEEINKIPSFIFCRWLSGNQNTIFAANAINCNYDIPMENQYKMIKQGFAGKIKFIPYPKQEKLEADIRLTYLCDYFKISEEKAKDYLEYISNEELNHITEIYTEQELKIRK